MLEKRGFVLQIRVFFNNSSNSSSLINFYLVKTQYSILMLSLYKVMISNIFTKPNKVNLTFNFSQ